MNLLYVIHHPMFSGPHNTILQLAEPLAGCGWRVVVLQPEEPGTGVQRLSAAGVEVVQMPLHRLRKTYNPLTLVNSLRSGATDVGSIQDLIRIKDINLVILCGLLNIQAGLAAHRERVPLIWNLIDSLTPPSANALFMIFVKRFADSIITTGSVQIPATHPGARSFGHRLVPYFPPVDLVAFNIDKQTRTAARSRLGIGPDEFLVGTAGNLNPTKGHAMFISAAATLRRARRNTRFVILGASYSHHKRYESSLRAQAEGLGLRVGGDLVIADPGGNLSTLMQAFDVFWLTSEPLSEGTPTVIEEAMALGVPVVSTNVGAVSELIDHGRTGILVAPHAVENMVIETCLLLDDPMRRESIGRAARAWAVAHYGTSACLAAHLRAMDLAIAFRKGRQSANHDEQ